jgi:aspartate-semialdehyde dehydrogenase
LRVLQAPVFYGHAFSCFLEIAESVPAAEIDEVLDRKPLDVYRDSDSPPTVAAVAGSDEIILGPIERDQGSESGYWLWGTLDNLRLAAHNAIQIAEDLISAGAGRQGRNAALGSEE